MHINIYQVWTPKILVTNRMSHPSKFSENNCIIVQYCNSIQQNINRITQKSGHDPYVFHHLVRMAVRKCGILFVCVFGYNHLVSIP